MSTISISFRIYSNASKTKQVLKVCAKYANSKQYAPRIVSFFGKGDLVNPDLSKWDKSKQRFKPKSCNSEANNKVLDDIEALCNTLLKENSPKSIEDFWKLVEKHKVGKPVSKDNRTVGWFLRELIDEMKNCTVNKLPSKNYQVYVTLLHHLEREDKRPRSKHIVRRPISQVCNKDFQDLGDYVRSLTGPNYLDIMKYFKRAHNIAIRKKMADKELTYRYADDAPAKSYEELAMMNKGIASLNVEQIKAFEELDLSSINLPCKNHDFYKELYKDTCLLMFYLYSRPIDILNMKYSHIRSCPKGLYVEYLPIKKKNSANAQKAFVRCPIPPKALAIIEKYRNASPAGYILPFSENKKSWELSDPQQYHTRFNRCNCMLGKLNSFLKKAGDALGISFYNDTFTMYVFRHSAISIAITEKRIPPIVVAKMAGTSLKEIERSYMDHTANMFDYI